MDDVDRSDVTEFVYQRLADPCFRERLTATASDGTRPILVALRDDPMSRLTADLDQLGGSGNVVMPMLNGFVVIAMRADHDDDCADEVHTLTRDCTVGVFVARLQADGDSAVYRFAIEGSDRREGGRAEVVALGG
ncbi:MAG TPA: hypothetical protein VK988_16890 [Acidimicrobiales bacterium]|nr:hypothetical protein [Acidimicrobiales bacterium]